MNLHEMLMQMPAQEPEAEFMVRFRQHMHQAFKEGMLLKGNWPTAVNEITIHHMGVIALFNPDWADWSDEICGQSYDFIEKLNLARTHLVMNQGTGTVATRNFIQAVTQGSLNHLGTSGRQIQISAELLRRQVTGAGVL